MKKRNVFVMLVLLLSVTACNMINSTPNANGGNELEKDYAVSNLDREMAPNASQEQIFALSQGNTAFAMALYDHVRDTQENLIFSPLSISLALSMTLAGAETSTEEAMMNALHLPAPESSVHEAFNALLLSMAQSEENVAEESEGDPFQLNIANSIWGQSGFGFNQSFLDTLALQYGAGIYSVDFKSAPEEARGAINEWISEETEQKISNLIPPDGINPMTRLVLANAIYFNGSWYKPFNENGTEEAPFNLLDGSQTTVDMMKLFGENLSYIQGENYQAVNLPYLSQDFSMLVIVPDSGQFSEVEKQLFASTDPLVLDELISTMGYEKVNLQMPKFDFETTLPATNVLKELGMADAFDPEKADFSGMTEEEALFISAVLHKATITVDEQGTEAAAATVVIMMTTSAEPEEPISLVIDRPFLFVIRHRPTGTLLFMGRVLQP
jgi:serpin B